MLSFGYWHSPLSGVRFNFSYGISPNRMEDEAKQYANLVGLSADYLYHLSNGERYGDSFSWIVVAGVNFSYANLTKRYDPNEAIFNFGFNTGLNISYNVNPQFSAFLEPKVTIYGTAQNYTNTGRMLLNLNTGIAYRW